MNYDCPCCSFSSKLGNLRRHMSLCTDILLPRACKLAGQASGSESCRQSFDSREAYTEHWVEHHCRQRQRKRARIAIPDSELSEHSADEDQV